MSPTKTARRYGAYHRVSQENGRDRDDALTVEDAWSQIDAWSKMRGTTIVEHYLDWDTSGSKMSRPELDRMLADLRAGVIDGIVVAQVDRFSRADVGDALAVVREILDIAPGQLVLLDLGIDPSTEFGEFGLTILLGLSRMQWRRYKRQWTGAQARAIAKGIWIGTVPYGYARGEDGILVKDPDTWRVVRDAFALAAGQGLHAAMAHLEAAAPGRRWRTDDVRRLLRSRAYLGESTIGEHTNRRAHSAITDEATWLAAQTEPRDRRRNGDYLLSGVATCAECGAGLTGQLQTVRDRTYRRYRCSNPACGGGSSINADKLEAHVRTAVKAKLGDRKFRRSLEVVGLDEAEQAVTDARAELVGLVDKVSPTHPAFDAWNAKLGAKLEAALAHLGEVGGRAAGSEDLPAAHEVDDDTKLLRAIRRGVASIRVARGRGKVEDRAPVVFVDDLDDGARVLAA